MNNKEESELKEIHSGFSFELACLEKKIHVIDKSEYTKRLRELQKFNKRLDSLLRGKLPDEET